jgi:hypothetical protein
MSIVNHCRRVLVPVFGLALLLVPAESPTAAEGSGRVAVTPTKVSAGSTNTFTLVFTADDGPLAGVSLIDVPPGWSRPQASSAGALGYVRLASGSCASATRLAHIVGRRLEIPTSCARGASFTLTYGPAQASTIAADGYVFLTQTRPSAPIVKTKIVEKVVKTKKGKRKTKRVRVRYTIKPSFRPLAQLKQPVVVVTGAAVDHLAVNAPAIVTSGTPFSIGVRAEDVYGNVACCYTGTVSFSSSDPEAFLPTPYTYMSTDAGGKTFGRVILRTPGTQTISATDDQSHTDASNPINVYPFPTG